MAYCAVNTDVKALTGFTTTYSTSSQPTLTEAENIVTMIDGEIDAGLAACGVSTPGSGLSALLKKYSAMGSAGLVLTRYRGENDTNSGRWFYEQYSAWIERLLTDTDYQQAISNLSAGSANFGTVYADNQVTNGDQDETATTKSFIDEDFTV